MSDLGPSPVDPLLRFAARHERAIEILGGAWFVVSCAVWARFIDLPEIPFVTDEMALYASAAFNALWWGFAQPALQKRKGLIEQGDEG